MRFRSNQGWVRILDGAFSGVFYGWATNPAARGGSAYGRCVIQSHAALVVGIREFRQRKLSP